VNSTCATLKADFAKSLTQRHNPCAGRSKQIHGSVFYDFVAVRPRQQASASADLWPTRISKNRRFTQLSWA